MWMIKSIGVASLFIANVLALAESKTQLDIHPSGQKAPLISDSKIDLDGVLAFTQSAALYYNYDCPIGGTDNRVIRIQVNFAGSRTTFDNKLNAEIRGPIHVSSLDANTYRVSGTFTHNMCLPRAEGRRCGYRIEGTLVGTTVEPIHNYKFEFPKLSTTSDIIVPAVYETCSEPHTTAPGCPKTRATKCTLLSEFLGP